MDGRLPGAAQRFKGSCYEFFPRLSQHLNGDIFRDALLLNQLAHKVEIGLRGGGEGDLYFFKTALQQQIPELQLTRGVHWFGQRLVAVAQIGGKPARRGSDLPLGPATIGQGDRRIRAVFFARIGQHGVLL